MDIVEKIKSLGPAGNRTSTVQPVACRYMDYIKNTQTLPVVFSGGHFVPEEGNSKFMLCVRTFYLFDTERYSENFSLYVDLVKTTSSMSFPPVCASIINVLIMI
jgi:hypothetical protein